MRVVFRNFAVLAAAAVMAAEVTAASSKKGARIVADEARDEWVVGFLKLEEAARAENQKMLGLAVGLYRDALAAFEDVGQRFPEWNPGLVRHRTNFCTERIKRLQMALDVEAEKLPKTELVILVRELRAETKTAQDRIAVLEQELGTATEKLSVLTQEKAELSDSAREIVALREARKRLESKQSELEEKLAAVTAENTELGKVAAASAALRQRADALAEEKEALRQQLDQKDTVLTEKSRQLLDAGVKAAALRATMEARDEELEALKDKVAQLPQLKKDLGDRIKEIAELRLNAGKQESDKTNLTEKLTGHEQALVAALTEKEALAKQVAAANAEVARRDEQLKRVDGDLAAKDKAFTSLKTELAKAKSEIGETAALAAERAAELGKARQELQAELAKTKELERLVALAKAADVDALHSSLEAATAELNGTKGQIEELKRTILAKEESERRLVTEKKRRLEEEREIKKKEREKQVRVHSLLKEGTAAEAGKDSEAAVWNFKEVLKLEPGNGDALRRIGIILADSGDDVEAERYLSRAFDQDPSNTEVLLRLGFSLVRQEKAHMGIACLARAVGLEPDNADFHRFLGLACSQAGWVDAAEAALRESLKLDSTNSETAFNLAVVLATLDERPIDKAIEEAKKWYQKAKELGAPPDEGLESFLNAED